VGCCSNGVSFRTFCKCWPWPSEKHHPVREQKITRKRERKGGGRREERWRLREGEGEGRARRG
jgi:hypothetical protein